MIKRTGVLLVALLFAAVGCSVGASGRASCQTPDLAVEPPGELTPGQSVTVTAPFGISSCEDGGSAYKPVSPGKQIVHVELSKYTGPGPGEAASDFPVSVVASDWITGHLDPDTGDLTAGGSIPSDLPSGEYFAVLAENQTIQSGHFHVG